MHQETWGLPPLRRWPFFHSVCIHPGPCPGWHIKSAFPASFGQEAFQNRHPGIIAVAHPDLARDRRTKETKNDGRADHDERLGDPLSHPRVHAAARAPCAATTTKEAVAATDGDAAKHLGEARRAGDRAMKRSIVAALLAMLAGVPCIPVSMADTSITDLFPKPGTKIEPFQPGTPWSTYAFAAQRCLLQGTPADVAYMLRRTFHVEVEIHQIGNREGTIFAALLDFEPSGEGPHGNHYVPFGGAMRRLCQETPHRSR